MQRYSAYGFVIESECEIPSLPPAATDETPTLFIRIGPPTDQTADPDGDLLGQVDYATMNRVFVRLTNGGYLLRFTGLADFEIDQPLRTITVRTPSGEGFVEGRNQSIADVLLAASIPSFVITMLGEIVVHASAVAYEGRVFAFFGKPGQGKSTMAALMCAAGASIVTDDALRLDKDATGYLARLGSYGLRLRKLGDEIVASYATAPARHTSSDGRTVVEPVHLAEDRLPLAAIIVPFPMRNRSEVTVRRLPPTEASLILLSNPRLLGWEAPEVLTGQFDQAMTLAEDVPMFTAEIPWGPPFAPTVVSELMEKLSGLMSG